MKLAENITLSLLMLCTLAVLTSCSSAKYLGPGETFLEENTVTIKSREKIKNKRSLRAELEQLYLQEQTRTWIPGIPRHALYYAAQKEPGDTTGIRKLMRRWGEPPVILDSALILGTIDNMVFHLRQRGYWNGEVDFTVQMDQRRSRVTYIVDPMKRWTVSSLTYVSRDTAVQHILDSIKHESFLAPGEPVDIDLYRAERERVTLELQNRGYANFFRNYITEPVVDSSNYTMDLEIEVTTPQESDRHTKFVIGDIAVYPDGVLPDSVRNDTLIDGITFFTSARPVVKPEIIARNIHLEPGELYSRDAYDKTQRQLGRLEMYRFITLKPEIDPHDSARLNYSLSLARNKKMAIGGEIEVNYSNLAQSNRSLIGLGGNITYRNRNIFRGAELFSTNIQAGVEVNINRSASSRFNSANFNLRNTLLVPRFIDPIGFYTLLNNIRPFKNGLIGDRTMGWFREGNTSMTAGYQYLSLFNLYSFHSFTLALGYDAQPDPRRRLQLNHIGLDFFNPTDIKPAFDTILRENIFLRESFRKQLFTGFLFRDYRFTYSGIRPHGISITVTHSAELSGLEIFGINTVYNSLANTTGGFQLGNENPVSFSQYAKFEIDGGVRYQVATNQQLAFRMATGLAVPYGPFSRQVPYIKQFYVGGPSSIRAWQIRELGPGGYQDPFIEQDTSNLPFYQTGDLKLELSAEYRFDLFWVFKGALFADAGNVWTIQKDNTRPGAVFSRDFMKQIAVGTGIGIRMDFDYFLIRLDFGYKLRQPYADEMGRYWLFHNFKDFSFRQITTNFAIGYPF